MEGLWKGGRRPISQTAKRQRAKDAKGSPSIRRETAEVPLPLPFPVQPSPVSSPAAGLCSIVVCFISSPSYCYARLVVSSCHVCRLARCPAAARHEISQSNRMACKRGSAAWCRWFLINHRRLFSALVADSLRIGHSSCTAALSPTKGPMFVSLQTSEASQCKKPSLCTLHCCR
ncbi:hypothetical protein M431DRAFT_386754 [Trichoderma harzianum CBS 226.95]|uniref:Uncharacterized protein n=1 Tax=Trichoderma harzianum CBS 226.95 TaxID=983964 RepID=A0A2T4AI84_TRIHA|nr:hypothetical protein M431DRAFT_386754 [Trichoderma harzianum CBS 226.95]PTB56804.1 hypothetical protein M431DRAFT_386754 [Trichoderma harzianum CBS 226.95]